MVTALFDTNILVDQLKFIRQARVELARYKRKAISIVTWIEVMVGATPDNAADTRRYLDGFEIVSLTEAIAEQAVGLRKSHRLKLPDAIIWASAQVHGYLLVTRNIKDYPSNDPGIRIPYKI